MILSMVEMIHEAASLRANYLIEPALEGWRVSRLATDGLRPDELDVVIHRSRDLALAYADAAAALEGYLASRERNEDSAERFEIWRAFDEAYETLALEQSETIGLRTDPWDMAASHFPTRH